MDQHHITAFGRALISMPSRRDILCGLTAAGLGLRALAPREPAVARRKRKRKDKNKKAKPNAFGCLSVNKPCKIPEQCCSGICEGKNGKRKCRAHGAGTCDQGAAAVCQSGTSITTACNNRNDCACLRTTAGSSFCAEHMCGREGCSECAECQRDADCVALGFPPGSACAPFSSGACAGICPTGMACMAPCGAEPPPPSEPVIPISRTLQGAGWLPGRRTAMLDL